MGERSACAGGETAGIRRHLGGLAAIGRKIVIIVSKIVVWVIVGVIAGSFTGMLVKRSREGFGRWLNIGLGLAGALIGGGLFHLFGIDLGLGEISISLKDLVAAFSGSIILLLIVWAVKRAGKRETAP